MSKPEKPMDHLESLAVISSMIRNTQGNFHQHSFYFILWGVVVASANLGHYYLMMHTNYDHPYIVWIGAIPAWIFTALRSRKLNRQARVITVLDRAISILWMAFGISIFLLIIPGNVLNGYFNPIILLMAAIPTIVTGYVIKEKTLIAGAILFWVFGSISFFLAPEFHFLISALAIILGFVIPGIIMRNKKK